MLADFLRPARAGMWTAFAVLAVAGCNGGGGTSKKSSSSTPATTTSTTTTTPVTTATNPVVPTTNPALKIVSAVLDDSNGDHVVSKGDILTVKFAQPIVVTATSPANELELLTFGDTFGTGATLAGVTTSTSDAIVVLGTAPKMKVTGTFSATATGPYQASGIEIASTIAGIKDAKGLLPTAGVGVDVTSTKLVEGCFSIGTLGMKYSRGLHTATLLDDGMVLVVGGITATGPATSNYQRENELFDPLTGLCSVISSPLLGGTTNGYMLHQATNGIMLKVGRFAHTATKMANGQVLITGGNGFEDNTAAGVLIYGSLATSFLYDPVAHKFTETAKLSKPRMDHSAILIAGGTKVLVFGGRDGTNGTTQMGTTEIFDSATGKWTAGPNMITPRYDHAVVATPTGVHVLGGASINAAGTYTDVTADEIYDATTNAFTASPVSVSPRCHSHTATLLDTGDILLSGGYGAGALLKKIQVFNRLLGTWTAAGDLAAGRQRHAATRLEGDVLVSGGMFVDASSNVKTVDTVETIGPGGAIKSFPLGFPRLSHTTTLLGDGRVLILGGYMNPSKNIRGYDGTSVGNVEIFVRP